LKVVNYKLLIYFAEVIKN